MTFLNRVTPGPDGKFGYAAVRRASTINARLAAGQGAGARGGGAAGEVFEFRVAGGGGGGAGPVMVGGPGGSGPSYWATTDITVDGAAEQPATHAAAGADDHGQTGFKGSRVEAPSDFSP